MMITKYYIVDDGEYGQGDAITTYISKKGNVLAEYTDEPCYFDTQEEANELLNDIKNRSWDYSFSTTGYIRNQCIKPENLKIVEINFDDLDE